MISARWSVAPPADPGLTAALASDLHIPEPLAAILVQRGLGAPEHAKAFLRPDLERLSDPGAWADMPRAVDLIAAAVRGSVPILVHAPGILRGSDYREDRVTLTDLAPTAAKLM